MVKRITLLLVCLSLVGLFVTPANAQWQGWLARQAIKQGGKALGKATGKRIVNRGAETKCIWGPFGCAKVAHAPAGPMQPRGPQRVPVQPRGPQRFRR